MCCALKSLRPWLRDKDKTWKPRGYDNRGAELVKGRDLTILAPGDDRPTLWWYHASPALWMQLLILRAPAEFDVWPVPTRVFEIMDQVVEL